MDGNKAKRVIFIRGGLNVLITHPNLSVVVPCYEASAVPGELTTADTLLMTPQCVDTLPGLTVPQLETEHNA